MVKKLQALKAKKGFTLVELVVVIAIIGILAAILVPTMLGVVEDSRITSANTFASNIKNRTTELLAKCDSIKASLTTEDQIVLHVEVDDKDKWTVTGTAAFKDGKDHFTGGTAATGSSSGDDKSLYLGLYLADTLSDMKGGAADIVIVDGKVEGVIAQEGANYNNDAEIAIPNTEDLQTSITDGSFTYSGWNGKAGKMGNEIIGTSPNILMG